MIMLALYEIALDTPLILRQLSRLAASLLVLSMCCLGFPLLVLDRSHLGTLTLSHSPGWFDVLLAALEYVHTDFILSFHRIS